MVEFFKVIEGYPQTVTIFLFLVGIIVTWSSGLFGLIKQIAEKYDNRLRVRINTHTARCSVLNQKTKEGKIRFIFILSVRVANPSEKVISVSDFRLQYKDERGRYGRILESVSFPNPPIVNLGASDKLLPVFGGSFPTIDQAIGRKLCPDENVLPGHTQAGYVMFIDDVTSHELSTRIENKGTEILLSCHDVRGRRYKTAGITTYLDTNKVFELIPGIKNYAEGKKFLS